MLGINAGRDKELKVGRFRHLSSNRCEEDCAWVCRDIFLWIIILCKEFSGIDIFKLEYLTKSLNPKKMMAKNFRRPAYEKSRKIHCVLFIALHFYFICQLSKFLLLFLCQSAKFISKFRSYAQSRNWITKRWSFYTCCLFLLFFPIVTHMFKVMKVDVKWLYAKMRDREKIRPSNIRDLSKSQPTSLFDSP